VVALPSALICRVERILELRHTGSPLLSTACRTHGSGNERTQLVAGSTLLSVPNADVVTVATSAGMLALWRGTAFAEVDGYDAWEAHVNERLGEASQLGELVPIGIQVDGAFGVRVAVAPEGATEREARYAVVTSDPYLLVADGGPIFLSSVEAVGDEPSSTVTLALSAGHYAVRATIVAWDDEPGARGPDGRPGPDSLADFLIAIAPSDGTEDFRNSEATFDPPS
jgi:hypothetical protein